MSGVAILCLNEIETLRLVRVSRGPKKRLLKTPDLLGNVLNTKEGRGEREVGRAGKRRGKYGEVKRGLSKNVVLQDQKKLDPHFCAFL